MRSRYYERFATVGADVFSATPTPTCPPGQHWVPDAPQATLKGIAACVPNVVTVRPLTFQAPAPVVTVQPSPATTPDRAAAPTPAPAQPATTACPSTWPLWWLFVAAAAGLGAGYYAERHRKKVRKNAGRIAGRMVNRASDVAMARLLG